MTKAVGPHATSDVLKWNKPAYIDQWEERGKKSMVKIGFCTIWMSSEKKICIDQTLKHFCSLANIFQEEDSKHVQYSNAEKHPR